VLDDREDTYVVPIFEGFNVKNLLEKISEIASNEYGKEIDYRRFVVENKEKEFGILEGDTLLNNADLFYVSTI
jgi:2-hydroxy-3-keto-5-methylthiopentenyl-1-phosphate phosphatase